jgi:enoyl-CoA hydratase/carnithine racemase
MLTGLTRAMEIVAFDEPISAEQALAWGVVILCIDHAQFVQAVYARLEVPR